MNSRTEVVRKKAQVREQVWRVLEEKNVAAFPRPVYGRVPNFVGAHEAARRLVQSHLLKQVNIVKVNPDSPQLPVRRLLLKSLKTVIMPTPRLREGFLVLDPQQLAFGSADRSASIRGAFIHGKKVDFDQIPKIDLVVEGSVAVNTKGGRLGKGEGYAELEYAVLREAGLVSESTPIVTTVHDLQVVGDFPLQDFDVPVDLIVTPTRIIETRTKYPRPRGVIWSQLERRKLGEIPLLRELARRSWRNC